MLPWTFCRIKCELDKPSRDEMQHVKTVIDNNRGRVKIRGRTGNAFGWAVWSRRVRKQTKNIKSRRTTVLYFFFLFFRTPATALSYRWDIYILPRSCRRSRGIARTQKQLRRLKSDRYAFLKNSVSPVETAHFVYRILLYKMKRVDLRIPSPPPPPTPCRRVAPRVTNVVSIRNSIVSFQSSVYYL